LINQATTRIKKEVYTLRKIIFLIIASLLVIGLVLPGCEGEPTEYSLTISSTYGGNVTAPGQGTFTYAAGATVSLAVAAEEGFVFGQWLGDVAGLTGAVTEGANSVVMNGDYSIIAEFNPDVGPAPAGWEPVTLTLLIRVEDERLGMGDYFGDMMEGQRFLTDRLYRTSPEAAPLWQSAAQTSAGAWDMYTGGWVSTLVSRDESGDFFYFYGGVWFGPFGLHIPDPDFYDVCEKLYLIDLDYEGKTGLEAREALMEDALFMAGEDSSMVHTVTVKGFNPWNNSVNVAPDMSAGVYGSRLWGYTIHTRDGSGVPQAPGGSTNIKIAMPSIVNNPWNPVDGSNWVYDMMPIRAASDDALLPHPVKGFWLPQRLQSAEIVVQEDLAMLDPDVLTDPYLDVTRVAEITVPDTAWVGWNTTTQEFITAAEAKLADPGWEAERGTALRKSVVVYEDDLFHNRWHDGSNVTVADFLMYMIYPYERGMADGMFYDASYWQYGSWYANFRGVEITDTDPLTIATYDDNWTLDPDWSITDWWPYYDQGQAAWHNLGIGIMVEADGEGAFSLDKSELIEKPWLNYVYGDLATGGPPLLDGYLQTAIGDETLVPYYDTFDDIYVDLGLGGGTFNAEAIARLANLDTWVDTWENFWLGTGPYKVTVVDKGLNQVQLQKNDFFKDDGDKWFEYCQETVGTPIPANTGAWCDQIDFSQVTQGAALYELDANTIQLYAYSISDGELFYDILPTMTDSIDYSMSYGSWSEFLLNTVAVFDDGRTNPFGDTQLREAIQWLTDRDVIADEVYEGMADPKFSLLTDVFPEAAERYPHIMTDLRAYYATDASKASDIIWQRMEALGFEMYYSVAEGKALWHYEVP
jgi:peptide/nickel transport system substrate-binding protein